MATKASDVFTPPPIFLLGAVMDEETRPLLMESARALLPGEGLLVVFRLLNSESADRLFEDSIEGMTGRNWNYVSRAPGVSTAGAGAGAGVGSDTWQSLVDGLEEQTARLRMGTRMLSQGSQKIKAGDDHRICYGIVTNPSDTTPLRSIKSIIHQQCNMGLNGDLLLHEGEIILRSLHESHVFECLSPDGDTRQRPIHIRTYGAGGSASSESNPGDLVISDAVIDARTHIDPHCIIEYLEQKVAHFEPPARFYELAEEIRTQFDADDGRYTAFEMVSSLTELGRLAAACVGVSNVAIMKELAPEQKRPTRGLLSFIALQLTMMAVHF